MIRGSSSARDSEKERNLERTKRITWLTAVKKEESVKGGVDSTVQGQ